MKKFKITKTALDRVKVRAEKLPPLKNSIRNEEGNPDRLAGIIVAYIGEEVAKQVLGGEIEDTYDYDIIYGETKVDVKTKERTVPPKAYYACSVADFNTRQDCDEYAFVNVLDNLQEAWYLGKISKKEFYKIATFHKKGEVDPDNNYTFRADCYNVPIRKLSI
jgi:hypothetical protein